MRVKLLVATTAIAAIGALTLGTVATARGHSGGYHGAMHGHAMSRSGASHAMGGGYSRMTSMSRYAQNRPMPMQHQFNRPEDHFRRVDRDDHNNFERDHMRQFAGDDRRFDFDRRFRDDNGVAIGLNFGGGGEFDDGYGAYPTDDYPPADQGYADQGYGDQGDQGYYDEGAANDQSAYEGESYGYYDAQAPEPPNEAYYYRHVGGGGAPPPAHKARTWRHHKHHAAGSYTVRTCTCGTWRWTPDR